MGFYAEAQPGLYLVLQIRTIKRGIVIDTSFSESVKRVSPSPDSDQKVGHKQGLLDTFSCCVQGLIPYGAQMLIAAGLAGLNPLEFIPWLFYPIALGVASILAVLFRYPRKYSMSYTAQVVTDTESSEKLE